MNNVGKDTDSHILVTVESTRSVGSAAATSVGTDG